ncbi:hypothetical protein SNEBB_002539 [Seison nebaliae]|nr:hypothetical protein SNEBB_002539 [Seison nebaliae]
MFFRILVIFLIFIILIPNHDFVTPPSDIRRQPYKMFFYENHKDIVLLYPLKQLLQRFKYYQRLEKAKRQINYRFISSDMRLLILQTNDNKTFAIKLNQPEETLTLQLSRVNNDINENGYIIGRKTHLVYSHQIKLRNLDKRIDRNEKLIIWFHSKKPDRFIEVWLGCSRYQKIVDNVPIIFDNLKNLDTKTRAMHPLRYFINRSFSYILEFSQDCKYVKEVEETSFDPTYSERIDGKTDHKVIATNEFIKSNQQSINCNVYRLQIAELKDVITRQEKKIEELSQTLQQVASAPNLATPETCLLSPCYSNVECYASLRGTFKCGNCPIGLTGNAIGPNGCRPIINEHTGHPNHMDLIKRNDCQTNNPCHPLSRCESDDRTGKITCGGCPSNYIGNGRGRNGCLIDKCANSPCFRSVGCILDEDAPNGYRCGTCPKGFSGNGIGMNGCRTLPCSSAPCYNNEGCVDISVDEFKCPTCPPQLTGNGIGQFGCLALPCHSQPCYRNVRCHDVSVNDFYCGKCPPGFTGDAVGIHGCILLPCSTNPCFPTVPCEDTSQTTFKCGNCPPGFTGNAIGIDGCQTGDNSNHFTDSIFSRKQSRVGEDQIKYHKELSDVCQQYSPCHRLVTCSNDPYSAAGYKCGPCPISFTGNGRASATGCLSDNSQCLNIRQRTGRSACYNVDPASLRHRQKRDQPTGLRRRRRILKCLDLPFDEYVCGRCPKYFILIKGTRRCVPNPCQSIVYYKEQIVSSRVCDRRVTCRIDFWNGEGVCGKCPEDMFGDGYVCHFKNVMYQPMTTNSMSTLNASQLVFPINNNVGLTDDSVMKYLANSPCIPNPCFKDVTCFVHGTSFKCGKCPTGLTGDGKICEKFSDRTYANLKPSTGNSDIIKKKSTPSTITTISTTLPTTTTTTTEETTTDITTTTSKVLTCDDIKCFNGVTCSMDDEGIVKCGECPERYTGDGVECTSILCKDNPCFVDVECRDVYDYRSNRTTYSCGNCPIGLQGDGSNCEDIDECESGWSPCDSKVECKNSYRTFECGPCPLGYSADVKHETTEFGQYITQHKCIDINECLNVTSNNCTKNSICINMEGSYECGDCFEEYERTLDGRCVDMKRYCNETDQICADDASCVTIYDRNSFIISQKCECGIGSAGSGEWCEIDIDLDGIPDKCPADVLDCVPDNCLNMPNSGQEDIDKDGVGDVCDDDVDNDGIKNEVDNCVYMANEDQLDADNDGFGDVCDNCPSLYNAEQTDMDQDNIGDYCDDDIDGDGLKNYEDNCPMISNKNQTDTDGDGIGDYCDNCPFKTNKLQIDTNGNGIGDSCDTVGKSTTLQTNNTDLQDYENLIWKDGDQIEYFKDNCPFISNPLQKDHDKDGKGDDCDDDDDNDGIKDVEDNCQFVYNPDQTDTDGNGIGDACEVDFDSDGVPDISDVCPRDSTISKVNVSFNHQIVLLDRNIDVLPKWIIPANGKEAYQEVKSDANILLLNVAMENVEFSGTLQINSVLDDDFIGIVFSFESINRFYLIEWKKNNAHQQSQTFWMSTPFRAVARPGLHIKKINSTTGRSGLLRNSIWNTESVIHQTQLLYHDKNEVGWKSFTPYRWKLEHRSDLGTIQFTIIDGNRNVVVDTGIIRDKSYSGGRIGFFTFAQEKVTFSNLDYRCLDD